MIKEVLEQIFPHSDLGKPEAVSGGDIGTSYRISVDETTYFCKFYSQQAGYEMAVSEKAGLQTLAGTACIATPRVIACEAVSEGGFLVLEYIPEGNTSETAMERMGQQLAALHKCEQSYFGAKEDNYIGRLEQPNTCSEDWAQFYCRYRLLPQFHKALANGLINSEDIPPENRIIGVLNEFTEGVRPALLHGDLWSGNYLIAAGGKPYLIDPSVYRGDPLVDIAMTRLFGGFNDSFYRAYQVEADTGLHQQERISLYQLYYLLVHLNLFGISYKRSVLEISRTYFS